jgi:hypothetical protein
VKVINVNKLEKITKNSLRKEGMNEIRASSSVDYKQNFIKINNIIKEFDGNNMYDSPRRRKMESTERQLFNLFEERGN